METMKVTMNHPPGKPTQEAEMRLVEQAKLKPEAFGALYKLHFEVVYRFVFHRLNEQQSAKDITQQTFVKAMLNIHSYKQKGFLFSSWLFRIAINELNRFYAQVNANRSIQVDSEGLEEMILNVTETPYEGLDELLFTAIKKLNDEQLLLIEMRYFEKRSFAEIGEILSMTENNAKVKLYRVIDKLKTMIKTN